MFLWNFFRNLISKKVLKVVLVLFGAAGINTEDAMENIKLN